MSIRARIFAVIGVVVAAAFGQTMFVLDLETQRSNLRKDQDVAMYRYESQSRLVRLVVEIDGVQRAALLTGDPAVRVEYERLWSSYERDMALVPEYIDEDIFIDDDEDVGEASLFDDGDGDPLFEQALEIVLQQGRASASYIQRKLKIGYNRAARIVELMEEKGIVGKAQGSKPRDIVRNPSITGMAVGGDSPGHTRAALRERGEAGDGGAAGSEGLVGLPPLVARVETAPGAALATVGTAASGGGLDEG